MRISKEVDEGLNPLEKAVESPSNLVVDGATKNKTILYLDLLKIAQTTNPVKMIDLVVYLHLKSVRVQ